MKRTLATTASVEARLPMQAQQILRQVRWGWMNHRGKNSPQPGEKSGRTGRCKRAPGAFSPHFPGYIRLEVAGERGWSRGGKRGAGAGLGNAGLSWAGERGALPPHCFPPIQELSCFTRKELRYFAQYLNWVGQTVSAPCYPAGIVGADVDPSRKQNASQQPGVG